jgi:hypothetical protein
MFLCRIIQCQLFKYNECFSLKFHHCSLLIWTIAQDPTVRYHDEYSNMSVLFANILKFKNKIIKTFRTLWS